MSKNKKYVTPKYLLSHGFMQYDMDFYQVWEAPRGSDGDLHFIEKDFDRNMFVVIFSPNLDTEEYPNHFHHTIYVQKDAGCGFAEIPERWWELPIEYFESIYYGIRGEKPKYNEELP